MLGNGVLFDTELESALLGSLIAEPEAFDAVADVFKPDYFATPSSRHVASAILGLRAARKPVDPVTVSSALLERQADVPSDHAGYLATLGNPAHVREYAERVQELWGKRELKRVGREIASDDRGPFTERMQRALARVQSVEAGKPSRVRHVGDMMLALQDELEAGRRGQDSATVFETGFGRLDAMTGGLQAGVLALFAARPGVGKSSFAVALADNLSAAGVPVGLFWLEDSWRDFSRRLLQRRARIASTALRNPSKLTDDDWTAVARTTGEMQKRPIWCDDTHGLTANEVASRMRRMSAQHGVRVFIADHLGEIGIERDDRWGDRHDLALGRAARLYRDTAKELDAAPVLCVQMNRNIEKRQDGPKLSDIDGSGQVEQAARLAAFLSRPTDERGIPTGQFCIDLVKNSTGPTGKLSLTWLEDSMTVTEGRL